MPDNRVLIICSHNSGRSQIAEAYLKRFAGNRLEVESAGLEPAERVNPLVVAVMKEKGSTCQGKSPKASSSFLKPGRRSVT